MRQQFQEITSKSQFEALKKTNDTFLVDFFMDNCAPCKSLSTILVQLLEKYPDLQIYKLNINDLIDVADRENISTAPTLHFYAKGHLQFTMAGLSAKAKHDIDKTVQSLLKI